MIEFAFSVYGTPAPQGSKRFVGHAKSGRGIMVESSKAVKPWREAVKYAAIEAMGLHTAGGATVQLAGPLRLAVTFTLPKPKSAPKKRRTYPDRKPDLSKLVRSTEDGLVDAGIIEDDARIIDCIAAKVYPNEGLNALASPGARIAICAAGEAGR